MVKNNCGLEIVHKFCFWCQAILSELINFIFAWEWKRFKEVKVSLLDEEKSKNF